MRDEERHADGYSELKDLRVDLHQANVDHRSGFSLCLWLYLSSSARPSSLILRQVQPEREGGTPFLALGEDNKLTLFPLMELHKEAPSSESSFPWAHLPQISAIECPLEEWVHIACEVTRDYIRLQIDGSMIRERPLSQSLKSGFDQDDFREINLVGNDGKLQGYVYNVQVLPSSSSIMVHFRKDPPVKLCFNGSCLNDGVEEVGDGVWNIVGGKASCRKNFSVEVVLLDAVGQAVDKEMEILASLIYADNGRPVEKSGDDADAPLLTNFDGLEFPSGEQPVKLLHGHATFKLKISQLSSKCDNRLFRIHFHSTHAQKYPFLEAFSQPIRCISRNRSRWTSEFGKRLASMQLLDETDSPAKDGFQVNSNCEDAHLQRLNQNELKCIPSSKRIKAGNDNLPTLMGANGISEKGGEESNILMDVKLQNDEGQESAPSDSESTDTRNCQSRCAEQETNAISDVVIFKYCLEDAHERLILLRSIIGSATKQDMADFAEQVCFYAGCSHHRYQILISKELIRQGNETWKLISYNNHSVLWNDATSVINKKFMNIAHSASRGLSRQDLEVLRGIAGCGDELCKDDFDKIWHWLYPVAFALSKDQLNALWKCMSPKWIEGLITREEAEDSLRGPAGLQEPGTFVLRFPTSRSWPHPDAGSLVVTYVGPDYAIHHKLLSIDHSSDCNDEINSRLLQDLLLEEPELSQLGRVQRQN